jgi:hypothetical protein
MLRPNSRNPSLVALCPHGLAPDIVDAIVEGQQPPDAKLAYFLEPFPLEWVAQPWLLADLR